MGQSGNPDQAGPRYEILIRLQALAARIARLRQQARRDWGNELAEELAEIDRLEHRKAALKERLQALDSRRPGFLGNLKAEIRTYFDDLAAAIEDFAIRLDSDLSAHARAGSGPVRK